MEFAWSLRPSPCLFTVVFSLAVAIAAAFSADAQVVIDSSPKTVTGRAPVITATVTNMITPGESPVAGHMLRADATAIDPKGDEVIGIEYAWKRGTTVEGTEQTYMPGAEDVGEIMLEVTAHTDPETTHPASGSMTSPIEIAANDAPVASGVYFLGAHLVHSKIRGTYAYADANNDAEGNSRFQWYRLDDNQGDQPHADSGRDRAELHAAGSGPRPVDPVRGHSRVADRRSETGAPVMSLSAAMPPSGTPHRWRPRYRSRGTRSSAER